ncbi:hypothetical protein JYU34_017009 [Plutella xylostella]|uniref:Uncharacterized protein n=1 Tax=Plutella xylostella TaxID=51655 RepID=A0ABQ7Q4B9_PLUXY|nr:hypothetical protein JYU34_017009 [Plutella xylostella]
MSVVGGVGTRGGPASFREPQLLAHTHTRTRWYSGGMWRSRTLPRTWLRPWLTTLRVDKSVPAPRLFAKGSGSADESPDGSIPAAAAAATPRHRHATPRHRYATPRHRYATQTLYCEYCSPTVRRLNSQLSKLSVLH